MGEQGETVVSRNALVLGGSHGIGRACADELHRLGHSVTSLSRHGAQGTAYHQVQLDVMNFTAVANYFQRLEEMPEILVFCVGKARKDTILDVDIRDIQDAFALNCISAIIPVRAAYRAMKSKRWGRIVLVSSILSAGDFERFSYAVSKAALEAIVTSCAEEFALAEITINAILPGPTDTELFASLNPPGSVAREEYLSEIPSGRIASPREIAQLIAYVVSEGAGYLTGQRIRIDGGIRS